MKKYGFLLVGLLSTAVFSATDTNTVLIDFDVKKLGKISCVEQIKKDGTVVFEGVITKEEYKKKYSGFWLKDNNTCAFYKKNG
jgi:hypothetical protein